MSLVKSFVFSGVKRWEKGLFGTTRSLFVFICTSQCGSVQPVHFALCLGSPGQRKQCFPFGFHQGWGCSVEAKVVRAIVPEADTCRYCRGKGH